MPWTSLNIFSAHVCIYIYTYAYTIAYIIYIHTYAGAFVYPYDDILTYSTRTSTVFYQWLWAYPQDIYVSEMGLGSQRPLKAGRSCLWAYFGWMNSHFRWIYRWFLTWELQYPLFFGFWALFFWISVSLLLGFSSSLLTGFFRFSHFPFFLLLILQENP